MVTGQALVLWSRLHLVCRSQWKLKAILFMICFNGVALHIPQTAFSLAVRIRSPYPFVVLPLMYSSGDQEQSTQSALQTLRDHRKGRHQRLHCSRTHHLLRLPLGVRTHPPHQRDSPEEEQPSPHPATTPCKHHYYCGGCHHSDARVQRSVGCVVQLQGIWLQRQAQGRICYPEPATRLGEVLYRRRVKWGVWIRTLGR